MKMQDKITLVFDMDGTIADLYGVDNWLDDLQKGLVRPFEIADPFYDMQKLCEVLEKARDFGWRIAVTSWSAKKATPEFRAATRQAKIEWLNKWGFPYDEIHILKYGTTKANATRKNGGFQILFDDNKKIRDGWNLGIAVNAKDVNIIEFLENLF